MGGGRFREHGELIPEAHTFFAASHWLHTGGLEEAQDVPEAEFRAAVQKYCPEKAEQIYAAVGLTEGLYLEGEGAARAAPMLPQRLPALANTKTVKLPPKQFPRNVRAGSSRQNEVTIRATDAPPGAPTPGVESPLIPEEITVEPTEGAKHHYEDAGTVDPAALNEALTATRPSDIEEHDTEAAYKQPEPVVDGDLDPVTGVAEDPIREPIAANLETGRVAHNDGSGTPGGNAPAGGTTPSKTQSTPARSQPSKAPSSPHKSTPSKSTPAKSQPSKAAGGKPKS